MQNFSMTVMEIPQVVACHAYRGYHADFMEAMLGDGLSATHITVEDVGRFLGVSEGTFDTDGPERGSNQTEPREESEDSDQHAGLLFAVPAGIVVRNAKGRLIRGPHGSDSTLPRQALHRFGRLYEMWATGYQKAQADFSCYSKMVDAYPGSDFIGSRGTKKVPAGLTRPVPAEGDTVFLLYTYLLSRLPEGGKVLCSKEALEKFGKSGTEASYHGFLEYVKGQQFASHPGQQHWVKALDKKCAVSMYLAKTIPLFRDCKWWRGKGAIGGILIVGGPGSAHLDPFSDTSDQSCMARSSELDKRNALRAYYKRTGTISDRRKYSSGQPQRNVVSMVGARGNTGRPVDNLGNAGYEPLLTASTRLQFGNEEVSSMEYTSEQVDCEGQGHEEELSDDGGTQESFSDDEESWED